MLNPASARERMVDAQVARRGIRDHHLLNAMRRVPREAFVDPGFEEFAYEDSPLPIGKNQTISQPYIVAAMIEAAEVKPGDRVLEVGTGSGYAAAVLSRIADQVYGIERHSSLLRSAGERLAKLGYDNIELRVGDGTLARIRHEGVDLCDGCGAKPAIHVANRCQTNLPRGSAERHNRHDRRYTASLRPAIRPAQETHN